MRELFFTTRHQNFNFEASFLKVVPLKAQHNHTKLTCQKTMLRQIERGVQIALITKT